MTYAEAITEARRQFGEVVEEACDRTVDMMRSLGATPEEVADVALQTRRDIWRTTWPEVLRILRQAHQGFSRTIARRCSDRVGPRRCSSCGTLSTGACGRKRCGGGEATTPPETCRSNPAGTSG
jgi:hypothetical protein